MFRQFLRHPSAVPDPQVLERDIRQQVRELEQEATAFHEAIGLLRAALSLSSEGETFWREKLSIAEQQQLQSRSIEARETSSRAEKQRNSAKREEGANAPTCPDEKDLLCKHLVEEGWRRERLHNHTLRNLYHQILEAKRRFLYHWHETLQQQLPQLPSDRQPPLRALLNNTLQGLLSMGIEQIEANHRHELEKILQSHPPTSSSTLDAVTLQDEDG